MTTRDVRQSEWPAFLDDFSRQHEGQLATVESAGREFGIQANAKNLPLLGITAEAHGGDMPEIEVMVGDSPDAHVVHVITRPAAVRVVDRTIAPYAVVSASGGQIDESKPGHGRLGTARAPKESPAVWGASKDRCRSP